MNVIVIIQEEVNNEPFYMFVEILNSKIINRPTAEVQPSVEDYGYMNHHICIFREAPVRCWVPLNCSMPAGIKVAKSFIRRLKYLNRKYCSHSAGRNGTTKVLVCPAQSCAKREHRGKERITRLPGDWGRNPCGVSRIKVKALIFLYFPLFHPKHQDFLPHLVQQMLSALCKKMLS